MDDTPRLGTFYVWLGTSVFMRDTYRDAYQLFVKALELGEEIEDQKIIGHACMWLSWTSAELGLHDDAMRFGQRAHKIAVNLVSDHFLFFKALSAMGHSHFMTGESKKSFELGEMILNFGNRHSDVRSLVFGQVTTGHGYLHAGDLPSAIACYQRAIEISADPFYVQAPRCALGMCYVQNNQFQEAEEALEEVLSYGTEFGCEMLSTAAKGFLGATMIATGRFSSGLEMLQDARQSSIEKERRSLYALIEYVLGKVNMQIAQRASPIALSTIVKNIGFLIRNVPFASKKAEYHFKKAIEAMRDIGAKGLLGQASLDLGLLHTVKGRTDEARECLSEAIRLFKQCEAEGYLKRAKEALASLG
jgi:hypothetical protein